MFELTEFAVFKIMHFFHSKKPTYIIYKNSKMVILTTNQGIHSNKQKNYDYIHGKLVTYS